MADTKLRVEAADLYFYPDVLVTCSTADAADPAIVREPVLLVEVLSPTSAAYDRGDKFAACRQLASLREFVLIDPQSRRCDVFRLQGDGLWVLHPFEAGQDLRLASVDLDLPAAVLWDEVPVSASSGQQRGSRRVGVSRRAMWHNKRATSVARVRCRSLGQQGAQDPAASFSAATLSVRSQENSGSSRPKCPYAAVFS